MVRDHEKPTTHPPTTTPAGVKSPIIPNAEQVTDQKDLMVKKLRHNIKVLTESNEKLVMRIGAQDLLIQAADATITGMRAHGNYLWDLLKEAEPGMELLHNDWDNTKWLDKFKQIKEAIELAEKQEKYKH